MYDSKQHSVYLKTNNGKMKRKRLDLVGVLPGDRTHDFEAK